MKRLVLVFLLMLAPNAMAEDRYSLVGGCYALAGLEGAEQVRLQATALGRYMLYRPDGTFVGANGVVEAPGPDADWTVAENAGGGFTFSLGEKSVPVTATPAEGCAVYPEAELNATGTPSKGRFEYARAGGFVEGHMHWMTYQYFGGNFHCGRPWSAYGITVALPDCADIEGPEGVNAPFQNFLNYGNPAQPHDTRGYPQMTNQSKDNLTYEGTYWRWVQRAWMSGLRVMVMGVNENRILCELQTNKTESCNEMDTLRRGIAAMREMEDYVDAQAGGPGKGFFQIVTDPIEARRVVNSGRMAVLLEIELSEPFDCANLDNPTCTRESVDASLEEVHKLGVRSSLLLGKFDNPLAGVRFDSGAFGLVINGVGNRASAGSFWSARTCKEGELTDNEIISPGGADAPVNTLLAAAGVQSGSFPAYPPAPHCNTRGLTRLGGYVVRRMMDLGMIVNPDHMSQAAVDDTLTILETRKYSGVISPHGWMDVGNWPRLWKLGGIAFPGHSSAASYVRDWEQLKPKSTPYEFGWGYGADLGGLSHQPRIEDGTEVKYPFTSYDGKVSFDKQVTGERTFDYPAEGVAHYGLYPEWFEDLRIRGGEQMAGDMWDGAEAYLQMWERATGVPKTRCFSRGGAFTKTGRGPLRLGASWPALLRRAGQPQQRTQAWSWCVKGPRNTGKADVAVLSRAGKVVLTGSTARRFAGPFRVGNKGRGLMRRGRFAALARGGRIRAVGVSGLEGKALRRALGQVVRAKAAQKRPVYVPGEAESKRGTRLAGWTPASQKDQLINDRLAYFCRIQARPS